MYNILIILMIILLIICLYSQPFNKLCLYNCNISKSTNQIENFTCDDTQTEESSYQNVLTQSQINQIRQLTNDQTMQLMNSSNSLMQGPSGPSGPQGQPGGEYQAVGRLVNQEISYKNKGNNSFLPSSVVSRTSGTIPTQSLCMMDYPTLGSFQYWYLNKNGTIQNKYDNTCINYDPTKSIDTKVYMGDCTPSNFNQWIWDKDNRLILKNNEKQCLTVSNLENGVSTTTKLGCDGNNNDCLVSGNRIYLSIKTYENGQIYDNEIWSFI